MRKGVVLAISISAVLVLAGCTSSGGGSAGNSRSPNPSPTATHRATTLDPCQLVTADEASRLSGVTFGPGKEETTGSDNTGKRCTYGSQTKNVFFVQVVTAATPADAQATWAAEEAKADAALISSFGPNAAANVTKTDITGLGDRAAVGIGSETLNGQKVSGSVIYLLKGSNFLAFGDLTLVTAPDAAALKAQAETSVGRMP
jgi:hypothetical protein